MFKRCVRDRSVTYVRLGVSLIKIYIYAKEKRGYFRRRSRVFSGIQFLFFFRSFHSSFQPDSFFTTRNKINDSIRKEVSRAWLGPNGNIFEDCNSLRIQKM